MLVLYEKYDLSYSALSTYQVQHTLVTNIVLYRLPRWRIRLSSSLV